MSQLAALGLFCFQLDALLYGDYRRRTGWRHAKDPRIGARDAVQFVGPDDDTISLGGSVVPFVHGSFTALDTLSSMADTGATYQFVRGDGRVEGSFVITGLDTQASNLMVDGVPQRVDFTLDLLRVA